MAPNDGIEIKATGSVHLSLQGKGGVGKSPVASILAQHLNRKALAVRCIDWDQAHDKGLRTAPLPLLREGGIDQRAFDGLMEELLTTDGVFVVNNGASTLIPLWNYIVQDIVHEVLRAAGKRLFVHTVITAGRALTDTIKGLLAIIEFAWSAAVMLLESPTWRPDDSYNYNREQNRGDRVCRRRQRNSRFRNRPKHWMRNCR